MPPKRQRLNTEEIEAQIENQEQNESKPVEPPKYPQKYLDWIRHEIKEGRDPSPGKFWKAFYWDTREHCVRVYGRLTKSGEIPDGLREKLTTKERDVVQLDSTLFPPQDKDEDEAVDEDDGEIEAVVDEYLEEDVGFADKGDQITAPFEKLVAWLYEVQRKYYRSQEPDPNKDSVSGTIKELYDYAEKNLLKWKDLHVVDKMSTMVAISGILNTVEESQKGLVNYEFVKSCCLDRNFRSVGESEELREVKRLSETFCVAIGDGADFTGIKMALLQEEVKAIENKEDSFALRPRVTGMVRAIVDQIAYKHWDNTTEANAVAQWEKIFRYFLPASIVTNTGEVGLESVDLLFQSTIAGSKSAPFRNIAVFEVKREGLSQAILDVQICKNLRLNKTVLCKLRLLDIMELEPLILDIRGRRAILYTIKVFDGFYGAGRVTEHELELPTSASELKKFLSNGSVIALHKIARRLIDIDNAIHGKTMEEMEKHVEEMSMPTVFTPRALLS